MERIGAIIARVLALLIICMIILNYNNPLLAVEYNDRNEEKLSTQVEPYEDKENLEQKRIEDAEEKTNQEENKKNILESTENNLNAENFYDLKQDKMLKKNQMLEIEHQENDMATESRAIDDGIYIIKSAIDENYVFDIYDNVKIRGANLELWENKKGENQKFNIKYLGNDEYCINAFHSNKCLDVERNSKEAGANVIQWDSNNQDNQKWIIKEDKNGYYKIISKTNNLCLDIPFGKVKNGANVQVWNDNDGLNQLFRLEKQPTDNPQPNSIVGTKTIEDGKYIIKSAIDENYIFDIYKGLTTNGANLELWSNKKKAHQIFDVKYLGNGEYSIFALHSDQSLDVERNSKKAGANVIQWDSNNQDNQKWIIKEDKNGYYKIISKTNSLCLDIPYGKVKDGANVQVWTDNGGINQAFRFEPIKESEIPKIIGKKSIDDGMYSIRSLIDDNTVLDIYGQSKDNGANVEIWKNNSTLNQKFNITYLNDGTYSISAVHSGKYLDVESASKESGTNVIQWSYNGENNQRWIINQISDEEYNIISKDSELFLTVESGNVCVKEKNNEKSQCFSFIKTKFEADAGVYGISGLKVQGSTDGSDLRYYKYGVGPNVFFATFAIHGWEDDFSYDGQELTKIANSFKDRLNSMNDKNLANKWTIYIFPSVNQDGEYHGWTHNGPGRTTLYSDAQNHQGIDMNRTWSTDWVKYTTSRNYTGTEAFQAYEARYLRDFLLSHKSTNGQTVLVDLHGWLYETMGDNGIGSYYRSTLGMSKHISSYGRGYLINWARANLGSNGRAARAALVELPEAYSSEDVDNWGVADKYINATLNMLREI